MATKKTQKLSNKEFLQMKQDPHIEAILGKLNGGSFMDCHRLVFAETGIWLPELVPIFERFDATLAFRNLIPSEVA
jgi:hypothetical protein